jgi:ATP-dependent helicase HrpB
MNANRRLLPIDSVITELRKALQKAPAVVLQAEPGAGKTTRVPLALLDEPWLQNKRILMLEPRRLAASNAARYMAACLGEAVGNTVGYAIRFDRRVSAATRIEVVTEGILTRRLQSDPTLDGVGLVIFDEFHERNLHADLALALCRDAQLGLRDDLKLLIMSATLDVDPVSRLLGNAPVLRCPGRCHPVEICYMPRDPAGPLPEVVARAVRRALGEIEGDILVFLPGAGEIRRCQEILRKEPAAGELLVLPLYGELPFAEQERALLPGRQRKVVLATNIAETSLTIEGVRGVVDSGFMRQARFHAGSGLPRLTTVRIAAANADQRAGRAGRLGPGRCYRLWSEATQGAMLPFMPAEIRTADLAPLALELACWGVTQAASLCWLDAPPVGALGNARDLLNLLGALDKKHRLTARGEAMARLPAHPRIAALLLRGMEIASLPLACDLAALLEERDLLKGLSPAAQVVDSDLQPRLDALCAFRAGQPLENGVDKATCRAVDRTARAWRQRLRADFGAPQGDSDTLAILLLAAYPDRVARRRPADCRRYLMVNGQGGCLSPRSGVGDAEFIVAVDVGGGRGADAMIRLASTVTRSRLETECAGHLVWRQRVFWDAGQNKVVARKEYGFGALLLDERPVQADPAQVSAALLDGLRQLGLAALPWSPAAVQLRWRVMTLARIFPELPWPDWSEGALIAELDDWLAPWLDGMRCLEDVSRLNLSKVLLARLDWRLQQALEKEAPTQLAVPSGHRVALEYRSEGPPVLAVKLQELFGLAETPYVAGGRLAVQLQLLSPARRPVAVTQDLRSFWEEGYPEVKRELAGRYPKHPWPADPWKAVPTRSTKKAMP